MFIQCNSDLDYSGMPALTLVYSNLEVRGHQKRFGLFCKVPSEQFELIASTQQAHMKPHG